MRGTRDRARRLTAGLAVAGALLLTCVGGFLARAHGGGAEPKDALTLVHQALAALEVAPPDLAVAEDKISDALHAEDTQSVDMARVQEAAQALGLHDPAAAASNLIEALRSSAMGRGAVETVLLQPVRLRFIGTQAEHVLLAGAAALVTVGWLIARQ